MRPKLMAAAGAILCAALWSATPAGASTTWRAQQVPVPANSAGQLLGVSCPATGVCMAVGFSRVMGTGTHSTLAELWTGGHWAILPTPNPAGSDFAELIGVSCLSETACTAVGIIRTPTVVNGTLVEHWDGASWTIQPSPDPAGTTVTDFTGVSCASSTSCTATGLYDVEQGGSGHEMPLAEHWDGTSWTVQQVPLPAGVTAGGLDGGVSCPSATDCIAVGAIATPNQPSNTQPFAERWNGARWAVQAMPLPAGAYNPDLRGVSCTSPVHCTAVGGFLANGSTPTSLVERWDGTVWTIQADAATSNELVGVSCTSSESCTAISGGVAEHWDGTSWTLQSLAVTHHAPGSVLGVSCVSATTCTAVGFYGRGHPLAEHE